MNSEPTQTCQLCSRQIVVEQTGRGFPPDVAKRKLRKMCAASGCPCEPAYRAGVILGYPHMTLVWRPRPAGQ